MASLRSLGIEVSIHRVPDEFDDKTPFDQDHHHASYDTKYVESFRRILINTDRIFKEFRARFLGKCSPVHFFWGSFDLGGQPVFRPSCIVARECRSDDARGLLSRSDQLRLLAGRPEIPARGFLFVHHAGSLGAQ